MQVITVLAFEVCDSLIRKLRWRYVYQNSSFVVIVTQVEMPREYVDREESSAVLC